MAFYVHLEGDIANARNHGHTRLPLAIFELHDVANPARRIRRGCGVSRSGRENGGG
jgi:hypothetical protein